MKRSIGPFKREPLADVLPELLATARGERPATLVVKNGNLVNVCSGEVLPGMSVAVCGSRIAYVGKDVSRYIGGETVVIDAAGRYVTPGLLDGHCHIESAQMTAGPFARAVLPHGTTGGFFDPHEIVNVLGLDGLRLLLEEARGTPLAAYLQVPSCVPSTGPELETSGASIGPAEVAEAFTWGPDVIALGEVMNFPGVVYGDGKMIGEIQATLRAGKIVDGHFTWPASDWRLPVYAAAGITGDHECVTPEDVVERVRLGMYAKLREASAWQDVARTIRAHTELGIAARRILLVTDDRSSVSILEEGHMDHVLRVAIRQGLNPVTAFQMATLNTAERFGVSQDVGSVTPGRYADLLILDGPLADVKPAVTIAAGRVAAENGRMTAEWEPYVFPAAAKATVKLAPDFSEKDFAVAAPISSGMATARAIQVLENHAETREAFVRIPVENGSAKIAPASGLCKMAVVERHHGSGARSVGFVTGLGFRQPAAIAMTVAHDSHNLLVIGSDDGRMAEAANAVVRAQGGIAVSLADGSLTLLPLPVAGLMSDSPPEEVAAGYKAVGDALAEAGCKLNAALMTISLLALVVIPELRLSDQGLVKISPEGIRKVPLFVEEEAEWADGRCVS
ncbi:adenine deaminase [Gorillibacterium sp. sgz5001074]|uniref:adenine deaminase n=1 Tax=Gorillibacterium sp. sgz5001074 TaxID=3446695 RepID=UPI003F67DB02